MFLITCYVYCTSGSQNTQKCTGATKIANIRFQTVEPRIHYQGFTDHCKTVLFGEPNPLSRLHKNNLHDSFLHESVKKLGFFLVLSDCALKYSGLDNSICSLKYQKDASDENKQYQDFKIFLGEHAPGPPSYASRK